MFETIDEIIRGDEKQILFLVDIGAMGFEKLMHDIPERAMNIGIFESGMVGVAAGLALKGLNPIIYGITPFIAERALEQIKLDFAYQKLGGTFITTGAAYDFSTLGYSHYCPEDAGIIKQLPGVDFIAPGTPGQMSTLLNQTISNGRPSFFRMSDQCNHFDCDVEYGKALIIKTGSKATVIAVSTMLDLVLESFKDEDVTILYYTTLEPFDYETLKAACDNGKVLVCEPEYQGTLAWDICCALAPKRVQIESIGIPREILRNYGTVLEKNLYLNFTKQYFKESLEKFVNRS